MFPLEFRSEVNHEETRVMELLCGEGCMMQTSTVFDWSTRATDGQTDGRAIAHSALSHYMLSRAKNKHRTI